MRYVNIDYRSISEVFQSRLFNSRAFMRKGSLGVTFFPVRMSVRMSKRPQILGSPSGVGPVSIRCPSGVRSVSIRTHPHSHTVSVHCPSEHTPTPTLCLFGVRPNTPYTHTVCPVSVRCPYSVRLCKCMIS